MKRERVMSEEKNNNSKPESKVKKEELRISSEKVKKPKTSKRKKVAIASVVASVAVGGVALGTILALQGNNQITLIYNEGGKEVVITVDKTTKISSIKPNDIFGYIFDGWYKDPGLTIPYTDEDVLKNEMILYPKFVAREYVITYYSNDGSNRYFEQKVYFDSEFSVLGCEYDRDHYGFVGWSTNPATKHSDSNILFENLPLILDTEGLNLYAVWKGEATTVSFNTENLLVNGSAHTIENKTVLYGETFTLPEISGATHATDNTQKFAGYIINGDIYQPGDVVTINSVSTVVEINWQDAFSALYFNMQAPAGETATPVATMPQFTESEEYEYVLPTANDLSNYEFAGWNTQADGKGTTYLAGETFKTNKSANVLYAMWTGKARTIVILDDTGATIETITCKYGDVITLRTLTKENYDFIGYNTQQNYSGENLKGETTIRFNSETTTLYVHFTRSQAIVSFNANGATGAVANISVDTFTTRTLTPDEIEAQKLALKFKYYNLAGWSLNQDAQPGDEGVGFDIVVGSSAQTYFAVWQRNKVSVTYTTQAGDIVPLSTQADQGTEFVLTDTGFEREGYYVKEFVFDGITYQIGDSISLMDEDVFTVEIQPVWKEETPVVFVGCDDITAVETSKFSDGFVNIADLKAGDSIYLPKPSVSYIDEEQTGVASAYATSQTNTIRKYFVGWSATKGSTTAEYFHNDDSTMLSVTNNCLKLYPVYQEASLEYFNFEDNGDDTYTATYKGGSGTENLSVIIFPNTYMGLPVVAAENTSTEKTGWDTRVIFPEGIKEINTNFTDFFRIISVYLPESLTEIGSNASFANSRITNIHIPGGVKTFVSGKLLTNTGSRLLVKEGITDIAKNSFANTNLVYVSLPSTIKTIGIGAFERSAILHEINFPEGVTSIGDNAFNGCELLGNTNGHITLPNSLESIGREAFANTHIASIVIPEKITEIPDLLFFGCRVLYNITFNGEIKKIGFGAFNLCSQLDLEIPETVEEIGEYAFADSGITNVVLPSSLKKLGNSAFGGSSVNSVTIESANLTEIPEEAFRDCYDLVNVNIPSTIKKIGEGAFLGCGILSFDFTNIETIGASAFAYCQGLTTIDLGDNVQTVEEKAFEECLFVEELTIGESVTSIAGNSFDGCSGIETLTLNTDISEYVYQYRETPFSNIGSSNGLTVNIGVQTTKVPINLFAENVNIVKVNFANGSQCTEIESSAFDGCTALKTVNIPTRVERIADYAFNYCTSLESITIPENVTFMGQGAFMNCTGLKKIDYNAIDSSIGGYYDDAMANIFANTGIDTSGMTITIGENVYKLPEFLFYCSDKNHQVNVKTINFNASYCADLDIGSNVFTNLGENGNGITVNFGASVERIPSYLFYCDSDYFGPFTTVNGPNIASINFEEGSECEEIGDYAFINCVNVTAITLPESLTYIGGGVFSGWTSLRQITIPAGVTEILEDTFSYCTSLRTVTFKEDSQCEYIYPYAFKETAITSITIPASVEYIYEKTFQNCTKLKEVNFEGENVVEIGGYAFSGCLELAAIKIPERVSFLGSYVFENCISLKTVTIPSSVTTIFDDAFYGCNNIETLSYDTDALYYTTIDLSNLKTLVIGDNVTTIPENMFEGLTRLSSVTMGYGISKIGDYAFNGCSALTSATISYSVMTIGEAAFKGTRLETVTFEYGSTCVTIGDYAFADCESLTEIEIPETVVEIGKYAFSGCSELQTINIPSMLYEIEEGVFSGCSALNNVTIPEGVTSIGDFAFQNCTSLTSITIPDSVTSIGDYAFDGCLNVSSVTIGEGVTSIGTRAFAELSMLTQINFNAINCADFTQSTKAFYSASFNMGVYNLDIGAKVTRIPAYFTSGAPDLYNLSFAQGSVLTEVGNHAFAYTYLINVSLPDTVVTIGDYAFNGCYNFNNYTLAIGPNVETIGDYAFAANNGFTEVIIGDSVTSIGDFAFYDCGYITEINIPNSVTTIGEAAFGNCSNVSTITIGEGVTSIGLTPFYGCRNTTQINFNAVNCADFTQSAGMFADVGNHNEYCNINIGAKVTRIPAYFTEGVLCEYNLSFAQGSVLTEVGNYAFAWTHLINISLPDTVVTIGDAAFQVCESLTNINIPASVTSIGNYAFSNCSALETVTIAENSQLTTIGDYAFSECTSLTSINIPASVTSIGNYAFDCRALETVTFAENSQLTTIGDHAFSECTSLTSINIPASVTSIGADAFYYCNSLETVTFAENSQLTTIGDSAFFNCRSLTSINISAGVTSIGDYAFADCESLTNINIPASVTSIGYSTFMGCNNIETLSYDTDAFNNVAMSFENLKTLVIGDNVTTIPAMRFIDCSHLTSVTIGNSVRTIGVAAFMNSSTITTINIPDSVETIEIGAFGSCIKLESIVFGSGVTTIGKLVLEMCTALKSITFTGTTPPTNVDEEWIDLVTSTNSDLKIYVPGGLEGDYRTVLGTDIMILPME